jgi:protocatechuate 3,4-dioxygenase alpha subunit
LVLTFRSSKLTQTNSMTNHPTTSQTVGPFFQIGLAPLYKDNLTTQETPGEKITIAGRILDADNQPVPDAVLEIWQANHLGRYAHPDDSPQVTSSPADSDDPTPSIFQGFGRIPSNEDGTFHFITIKPGPVPAPDGTTQLPHIVVSLFMRGLLRRLITRIYFVPNQLAAGPLDPSDPSIANDFILKHVPTHRRHTLFLQPSPQKPNHLTWTIHLQGPQETVFFEL